MTKAKRGEAGKQVLVKLLANSARYNVVREVTQPELDALRAAIEEANDFKCFRKTQAFFAACEGLGMTYLEANHYYQLAVAAGQSDRFVNERKEAQS